MEETLFENVVAQYNTIIENRFKKDKIFNFMEINTEASRKIVNDSIQETREALYFAVNRKLNEHIDFLRPPEYYKNMANQNSPVAVFGSIRSNILLNDFSMFPLLTYQEK